MSSSPPAWGFGSSKRGEKIQRDRDNKNVAPGSYETSLYDKEKAANYSMGTKFKSRNPTCLDSPAPGTYA